VADERSCSRARDVDRHETELREIRERYYLKETALAVITALTERVRDLENEAAAHRRAHEEESTSIRRGNRVAILAAVGTLVTGVALQFVTKGGSGH
jgi:hypothetical protein